MTTNPTHYVYGPVPSRRLGRSLGIDLVPFKTCTYDCVYCQLGRTPATTVERRENVPVADVLDELEQKLAGGASPDYISLAGSGEPTLHAGIGALIRGIKARTSVPLAVLTNGSLLWRGDVQDDLMGADLVLPSLDAGNARLFQRVNRPHRGIAFDDMVGGLVSFTRRFPGEVWLEVFLLDGLSASPAEIEEIAAIVRRIAPRRVQLNTVARPPAEAFARRVALKTLVELAARFPGDVDIICDTDWSRAPGDVLSPATRDDVLAMLGRRPCTAVDVANGLRLPVAEALKYLEDLTSAGAVATRFVDGRCFYAVSARDAASSPPAGGR